MLIIITVITFTSYVHNIQVTQEGKQILKDAYDSIKNIELNQRTNTSVSYIGFMIFLIFTLFSFKLDDYKSKHDRS